jgi:hypothetical protein
MDPGKLDLARRLYVFDFKSLSDICITLDISMFKLQEVCDSENWDKQREEATAQRKATQGDTLAEHKYLSEKHLRWIDVLLIQQSNPDLSDTDRKKLRGMAETAQTMSLALSMAVDTDRKIHGVKNSAPSVSKDREEVQGVAYFVGVPKDPASEVASIQGEPSDD